MAAEALDSNVEWKKWGQVDPLFGVSAWKGRGIGDPAPWTDAEFYELGRRDWEQFAAHWEKYGFDRACCVEVGCGAGRITMQLADCFGKVHAIDVSEGMIEYARQRVRAPNVAFHLTNGMRIPVPQESATAVFSSHVFQHFDALSQASAYFAEITRVLKPGGTMMIHVPIHRWPAMPGVFGVLYSWRKAVGGRVAWLRRRLLERGLGRPIMRGLSYPLDYLFDTLPRMGLVNVEVWIFSPEPSNRDPHPFVLARRAPPEPL